MISFVSTSAFRWVVTILLAAGSAACTIDKTKAPALAGPSEFGLSLDIGAFPDTLNRDGASQSTIQIVARGPDGKPLARQNFRVSLSPVNGGVLSAEEVATAADGTARVIYTAAAATMGIQTVRVAVSPVGGNYDNSRIQTIAIGLRGSAAPSADFEILTAEDPMMFDTITFDASDTTLNGQDCDALCRFSWNFGDGSTASGEVVTHQYENMGTYTVTLVVTGPDGVTHTIRKTVVIAEAPKPEADITASTTTAITGQTVRFSGAMSVGNGGATIVKWEWDINGETAEGQSVSATFDEVGAYLVVLTVTDSKGQKASATVTVTVELPEL